MAQRHGLELLYAAEGAIVDIVFVHGLFGHPVNTWTSEQSKARTPLFWPQKLLPSVVPQSRIYTWGYDVDINHLFSNASQATVFQHAGSLLSDLADERISDEHKNRPIIFVTHSLGGIVVKDMLNASRNEVTYLKDILPATYGIIFLGTPHRGSATATLGKMAQEITRIFWKRPNLSVLRDLEVSSHTLDRIGRGFCQILVERQLEIHSFREELPTNGVMVVDNFSSAIETGQEVVGLIPADHVHMTKFSGPTDIGFKRIAATLTRWTDNIKKLRVQEILDNSNELNRGHLNGMYYVGPSSSTRRPPHDKADTASSTSSIPSQTQSFVQTSPVSGPHQWPYGEDLTDRICILTDSRLGGTFPLTLANNAFSDVVKGKLSTSEMGYVSTIFVAVKIFCVTKQTASDVNRRIIRESYVWLKLKHPNIQPYLGHCSKLEPFGHDIGLVSPLCDNGAILDYVRNNPRANKLQLVKDVTSGLRYLDEQDVVHGDLHCSNVLVTDAGHAVLTDFGCAKVIGKAGFSATIFARHISYMAPELLTPDDSFHSLSKKSDIYAFGMLCFETFTNTDPFSCYDVRLDYQILRLVLDGKRPMVTPRVQKDITQNMWRIMDACWKTAPQARPSAEQIIQCMD